MKKFIRKPKKGDKPESDRKTYIIDAEGQVLGKIATCAVGLIRGKGRPDFAPHMEQGDNVVVVNASGLVLTGNKAAQKVYRHHTLYPGGLKTEKFADIMKKNPGNIIWRAVYGMLPKNKLRARFIKRLTTVNDGSYEGEGEKVEIAK